VVAVAVFVRETSMLPIERGAVASGFVLAPVLYASDL
jgi:hypothetical protein